MLVGSSKCVSSARKQQNSIFIRFERKKSLKSMLESSKSVRTERKTRKQMEIIEKRLDELVPYEKNPRVNDDAVEYVAKSIQEFGFKVPIIIDKNNVIVAGHTRLKSAKALKMETVPCIIADDLTDEQIKAFRLADNSVAEFSDWDFKLLEKELDELGKMDLGFGMDEFGFNLNEEGHFEAIEPEMVEIEFKYENVQKIRFEGEGEYELPKLRPVSIDQYSEMEFVSFGEFSRTFTDENRSQLGLHFYTQDSVFKPVWDDIDKYSDRMLEHRMVICPDFSIYPDFPKSLRIWNTYRNRWVGAYLQSLGQTVIPNVRYLVDGDEWMFDGLPHNSLVAFSTYGAMRDEASRKMMAGAYHKMMEILEPEAILWFGGVPKELSDEIENSPVKIIRKKMFTEWYLGRERR